MEKKLFSISEAAKLGNVTRQTLIYYDKKGLLKPILIGKNKYRYYSMGQIEELKIIHALKAFQVPLKAIKEYLKDKSKKELLAILDSIQKKMERRILEARSYIDSIEYKKENILESLKIEDVEAIFLEEKQAWWVYEEGSLLGKDTKESKEYFNHFERVYAFETQLREEGVIALSIDGIIKQELITLLYNNEVSSFCVPVKKKAGKRRKKMPAGLYLSAYNQGPYMTSKYTYYRLLDYMKTHGLEVDGDAYETNMGNIFTENNMEHFLLKISIKVKRI